MYRRTTLEPSKATKRFSLLATTLLMLAACTTTNDVNLAGTAAFRVDRYEEMQRIQGFEQCSQEGLTLDAQARSRASTGAFLSSARVLERCIADVSASADAVPRRERMRIHALATVNYFKGGDIEAARRSLDAFKVNHPGQDLYFGDSTSFIETVEVLLGRTEGIRLGQFAVLNVDDNIKREIRRMNYWKSK